MEDLGTISLETDIESIEVAQILANVVDENRKGKLAELAKFDKCLEYLRTRWQVVPQENPESNVVPFRKK